MREAKRPCMRHRRRLARSRKGELRFGSSAEQRLLQPRIRSDASGSERGWLARWLALEMRPDCTSHVLALDQEGVVAVRRVDLEVLDIRARLAEQACDGGDVLPRTPGHVGPTILSRQQARPRRSSP